MASILLHNDRLEIKLTAAEKVLALRKDDVVVERKNIRAVSLTEDPWIWMRGVRAPGTAIPLTLAVGQWKFHGGKDFLVLKGARPAVVIDLEDDEFTRVIVSTKQGVELIAALKLDERKPRAPRVHKTQPRTTAVASVKKPAAKRTAAKPAAKPAAPKPSAPADKPAPRKRQKPAVETDAAEKSPSAKPAASKDGAKPAGQGQKSAARKPQAKKPESTAAKPEAPEAPAES